MMRLVIIDEIGDERAGEAPIAAEIARRASSADVDCVRCAASNDADGPRAAAALAGADAGIVVCAGDAHARGRALGWLDAHLPADAPGMLCCHAASATLAVAKLATAERMSGFALLPPAGARTVVECARARQTSERAASATEAVWRALGLEPAWVGDGAGLVMPRLVAGLANEAAFAVMEGAATASDIDRAMRLGTRYPLGPLAWADQIGLPAVVATLDALAAEDSPDRYRVAPLLRHMAAAGERWFPDPSKEID